MKSLLLALPRAIRNRPADGSEGFAFTHAVLGAVLCIVIPLTTAYAQDFSGTVSCVETSQVGEGYVSTETEYDVEMTGGTISGRWGEGKDTLIGLQPFYQDPGEYPWDPDTEPEEFFSGLSAIIWTIPVDAFCGPDEICLPYEAIYSETGRWKFRVQKGELSVRGTSYAVMDYPFEGDTGWTTLSAQCTWTLKGPLPS